MVHQLGLADEVSILSGAHAEASRFRAICRITAPGAKGRVPQARGALEVLFANTFGSVTESAPRVGLNEASRGDLVLVQLSIQ
jgi:hypothetical protein